MTIKTADRLRTLRQNAGYSQEALAEKLGVSRQAVSKWERAEASPDIDNLIALSKLYSVTIDEILLGAQKDAPEQSENGAPDNDDMSSGSEPPPDGKDHVDISLKDGIHVHSKTGDRVDISFKGIHVHSADGDFNEVNKSIFKHANKSRAQQAFRAFPYPIFIALIYLALGFIFPSGFALGWILFFTIPLYYTLIDAIFTRDLHKFAYPVLVAAVYLFLGMCFSIWHPTWLIFLTVPLYYCIPGGNNRSCTCDKDNEM